MYINCLAYPRKLCLGKKRPTVDTVEKEETKKILHFFNEV